VKEVNVKALQLWQTSNVHKGGVDILGSRASPRQTLEVQVGEPRRKDQQSSARFAALQLDGEVEDAQTMEALGSQREL
jgi:hypothetical protein